MSSRHLVDPELLSVLDAFPAVQWSRETIPQTRAMVAELFSSSAWTDGPDVETFERHVPGPRDAPKVRVLIHRPAAPSGPRPVLLHIHGGGYLIGLPEMTAQHHRNLVRDVGCVVVSVDYRLAPETPFPGPLEDCYAALKWVHRHAETLGADPSRIAIGGESAGGGLAAALAVLARDRGDVPVIFQLLIYPMIDDRTVTRENPHPYTGEFVWSEGHNRFGWSCYLGIEPGTGGVSNYAAAARTDDLCRLPPAYISVGALDLFLDENVDYAVRLTRAGVPTELHVYPGAFHGYAINPDADITKVSAAQALRALKRAFAPAALIESAAGDTL
jgi:acetyl esterase/lipase